MALPIVGAAITVAIVTGAARLAVTAVGFGVITYLGTDILIDQAMARITSSMSLMGAAGQLAGLLGIDEAIKIILSAFTIRVTVMPLKKLMMM